MIRAGRRILAAIAIAVCVPGTVAGQWDVRRSAAVDLWYHGLALVAYEGPGPLPFYSSTYAAEVRADKARRGIRTLLDRDAAALRDAFRRDSTFESLHFLPLYHPGAWPADIARAPAVRRVFGSTGQQELLRRLANALDDEWRLYLRDARERDAKGAAARLEAARAFWASEGAPLARSRTPVRGGIVLLVEPLGGEGRVVRVGATAVVAVQAPPSDTTGRTATLSVLRELCFVPSPRADGPAPGSTAARHAASRASSHEASRCGAGMLAHRPDLAAAYRALFHQDAITRR